MTSSPSSSPSTRQCSSIEVYARCKPIGSSPPPSVLSPTSNTNFSVTCGGHGTVVSGQTKYRFNHVFGDEASQDDVHAVVGTRVVRHVLSGYHATMMAYGQTGSGKTHTVPFTFLRLHAA
eukprot:PhM_4_TR7200/c1_g1_i1/m.51404